VGRLGALQYASLEDDGAGPAAVMRLVVKHDKVRLRMEASVCSNWREVLDGSIYKAAAARQKRVEACSAASKACPAARTPPSLGRAAAGAGKGDGGKQAHDGEAPLPAAAAPAAPPRRLTTPSSIVQDHQRIQWIGDAHDLPPSPPCKSAGAQAATAALAPPSKRVGGRKYYSKVLLANGSEVRVGSAVLLQAPEGEEPFLAQVCVAAMPHACMRVCVYACRGAAARPD